MRDFARLLILCAVGGSADAIAYVRFGTFVGAMTGNTVLLAIAVISGHADEIAYHFCIIATFFVAVIAAQMAQISRIPAGAILLVTAAMLAGSAFIENKWSAALSAGALGVQNGAIRRIGGVSINSVFVTGNLVNLASALPRARTPQHRRKVVTLATGWLAYFLGAAAGAASLHMLSQPMIVPAVLAVVAAVLVAWN